MTLVRRFWRCARGSSGYTITTPNTCFTNRFTPPHLLGGSHKALGNHSEAREAYERALLLDPDNAEILNSLGVVEVEAQAYRRAIVIFKDLYDRYPDHPDYGLNLAVSYYSVGDTLRSLEVSRAVISEHPDFGSVSEEFGSSSNAFSNARMAARSSPVRDNAAPYPSRYSTLKGASSTARFNGPAASSLWPYSSSERPRK